MLWCPVGFLVSFCFCGFRGVNLWNMHAVYNMFAGGVGDKRVVLLMSNGIGHL